MSHRKPSREDRTLALLRSNRNRGKPPYATIWPPGSGWGDLKALRIEAGAQHVTRLVALRQRGHVIDNEMIWNSVAGEMWSWYRLKYDAAPIAQTETIVRTIAGESERPELAREWIAKARGEPEPLNLFGDLSPDRTANERLLPVRWFG